MPDMWTMRGHPNGTSQSYRNTRQKPIADFYTSNEGTRAEQNLTNVVMFFFS